MDRTVIGIALFALVIVVGFIAGLRLSAPGPQRKAVSIAFGLMAAFAALFYVCGIVFSLPWAAPVFATLIIIAPIATYGLIVRHFKAAITVSRRNPNDPPRPPRNENRSRSAQASGPINSGPMPAVSTRPANNYYGSGPVYDDEPDYEDESLYEEEYDEPAYGEDVEEVEEEEAFEPEPVSAELAEAFIDEYLVGENEIDDGFFEPEPSPTLRPHQDPEPVVSSSMMVTVPHPEGDERFLVVSESMAPANPILAYRRTTSSHLVHLGVAKNGEENEAPLIAAALAAQRSAAAAEAVVAGEDDSYNVDMFEPDEAYASRYRTPAVPVAEPVAEQAPAAAADEDVEFERERAPKHARAKHAPKAEPAIEPSYQPAYQPEPELETAPAPERAYEPAPRQPEYAPAPADEYSYAAASMAAPAPEPARAAYEPAPAAAPDFSYSLETLFQREPEPEPAPAYEELPLFEMQSTSMFVPINVEPQPAEAPSPEPAYEPAAASAARVASAAWPAAAQPEPAPVAMPASAPIPQPMPAAAPATPQPELTPFESYMAKAEGLRAKGVYAMAARIFSEAAVAADSTADNHRARFEEIACYVAAGQGEKAQAVAATLRASSVLTKVERFKLNAIERMA